MASTPASEIGFGVSKSGSPALRATTGCPCRRRSSARAFMASVADGCIAATRSLNRTEWVEVDMRHLRTS